MTRYVAIAFLGAVILGACLFIHPLPTISIVGAAGVAYGITRIFSLIDQSSEPFIDPIDD
tara:strand:- start:844 stop:1023 length:180 start_codon:yes stop_codon:yes gene_type:complete